jgi:hypothetical protein
LAKWLGGEKGKDALLQEGLTRHVYLLAPKSGTR